MKPERCSQRNSTAFFLIHQLVWRWLWKKLTHLQTKWATAQWGVFLFGFILLKWRVIKQIQNHISRRQHVGLIDSSCNSSSRFYLRNHCCCSLSDILAFISDNGVTKEIKTDLCEASMVTLWSVDNQRAVGYFPCSTGGSTGIWQWPTGVLCLLTNTYTSWSLIHAEGRIDLSEGVKGSDCQFSHFSTC